MAGMIASPVSAVQRGSFALSCRHARRTCSTSYQNTSAAIHPIAVKLMSNVRRRGGGSFRNKVRSLLVNPVLGVHKLLHLSRFVSDSWPLCAIPGGVHDVWPGRRVCRAGNGAPEGPGLCSATWGPGVQRPGGPASHASQAPERRQEGRLLTKP